MVLGSRTGVPTAGRPMSGLDLDVLMQPVGSFAALAILATVELWARSLRRRRLGTPRDGLHSPPPRCRRLRATRPSHRAHGYLLEPARRCGLVDA